MGGFTEWIKDNTTDIGVALTFISIISLGLASVGSVVAITSAISLLAGVLSIVLAAYMFRLSYLEAVSTATSSKSQECINNIFLLLVSINLALGIISLFVAPGAAVVLAFPILIYGDSLATAVSKACNDLSQDNGKGL